MNTILWSNESKKKAVAFSICPSPSAEGPWYNDVAQEFGQCISTKFECTSPSAIHPVLDLDLFISLSKGVALLMIPDKVQCINN